MDYTAVGTHDFYTFLLVFSRFSGLMVMAPVLGNTAIPKVVRAGLVLVLSLAVTPLVSPHVGAIPANLVLLGMILIKESLFGLILGYIARILFASVEIAGFFVDTQMGFGMINLLNPYSEQQASIMSAFQFQLATVVYLLSNGHLLLLGAVVESFSLLPPGTMHMPASFGLAIVPVVRAVFMLGIRISLPATGVLLVVDMGFGLIARMVPQLNVFIVGTPAKILIGLSTVALVVPVLSVFVGDIVMGTLGSFHALAAAAK